MQPEELDTFAADDLRKLTEAVVNEVRLKFDQVDGDYRSAILLLLCSQVLEFSAYEIARGSSPNSVSRLILLSAELNDLAQNKWKLCQQS